MTDIDRIKNAVPLADLVGRRYELNGGRRYRNTKEHSSLVVDTETGAYWWNSKGENGDIIDWVGRHELNYNGTWNSADPVLFKEAVTWLAKHAGLPDPTFKPEDPKQREARLGKERLMTLAADHYRAQFEASPEAQSYATGRGFDAETIKRARLGYSGGLLAAIPQQDRPTAAELGLIYQKGNGYRDSIPPGYLVYIHYHRGKVEYMAGRALAEKRHMNQRGPKRLYWATWPGYNRPLVICEGQADAISLAQLGVSALGLCGVNLSDFDPDMLRLFKTVYVAGRRRTRQRGRRRLGSPSGRPGRYHRP